MKSKHKDSIKNQIMKDVAQSIAEQLYSAYYNGRTTFADEAGGYYVECNYDVDMTVYGIECVSVHNVRVYEEDEENKKLSSMVEDYANKLFGDNAEQGRYEQGIYMLDVI